MTLEYPSAWFLNSDNFNKAVRQEMMFISECLYALASSTCAVCYFGRFIHNLYGKRIEIEYRCYLLSPGLKLGDSMNSVTPRFQIRAMIILSLLES